jgi:seryl-tRNA synthetase
MIDIHQIRDNQTMIEESLKKRHSHEDLFVSLNKAIELDQEWRKIKKEEEDLRAERNKLGLEVSKKKKPAQGR